MDGDIMVRPLETPEEFRACHAVQKAAWNFSEQLIIPYTQLITLQANGGVVLGAFGHGKLVGLVFGYLARQGTGPLYLFSQRLGVLPGYQGRGIGECLKWAQRTWALGQGLDRIVWTYEPLASPSARLNIAKLRGVARQYKRDMFGHDDAPAHNQLPTDRLLVEWELLSNRVLSSLASDGVSPTASALLLEAGPPLNTVTWSKGAFPLSSPPDLARLESTLLAEVPGDWQGLLRADPSLARDWRTKTRRLLEHYLGQGYAVTEYAAGRVAGHQRSFYLLEKQDATR
jgi:predicted GNAT superfamily acetyltransferase